MRIQYISWRRRRGENISVDLSLFVLLYNANFMNKLKFYDLKKKANNNSLTVHIIFNLQNHPTFRLEERLVKLARGRECFAGLSVLLVYEGYILSL